MNVINYPKLPDEIMERVPEWDETRDETVLLREIARFFGLTIREFLFWHSVNETKERDHGMWIKTTPRVLRDWFKAVKAEMEKGAGPKTEPEFLLDLGRVALN